MTGLLNGNGVHAERPVASNRDVLWADVSSRPFVVKNFDLHVLTLSERGYEDWQQ